MIEEIVMDFVKNPSFVFYVFCLAEAYESKFDKEFAFEIVAQAGMEYDFITTCLL